MRGCSPELFPPVLTLSLSLSRPLRTALLRACCAARLTRRRGRSPSLRSFARFSRFVPPSLLSPRHALCFSGRCAQHCSRPLASSPSHIGCSPEHFPLARSRCLARACLACSLRSFARFGFRLSLASQCSALLCYARASALFVPRLLPLLSSCPTFSLFSPRASPLFSPRLDTSLHPVIYCKYKYLFIYL